MKLSMSNVLNIKQRPAQLFEELQQQYYRAWFRFHPEEAVDVGVSDFSGELRSYSDDDIGALKVLNQKLVSALDEMRIDDLDVAARIDFKILRGAAEIELHALEEQDWRFRNPAGFVPVNAIYQLLVNPVEDVHKSIKHRLLQYPGYLRGAKVFLSQAAEQVVPVWLESAIDQCQSGAGFIRALGRHPLVTNKFTNPARLQPLLDEASHALENFAGFLEKEILPYASGNFACGERHFNRLLNERHFLETSAKQVLAFGERMFDETRQALLEQTKSMQGNEDIEGLHRKICQHHPQQDQLLNAYRNSIKRAFQWWSDSGYVSMPEKQSLKVQETPEFMRHLIPFAAYKPPSPADPEQHGLYYVTTVSDNALLSEHNDFSIDLTCAHEAFPGHHLQFVIEHQHQKGNYTRLTNASASMYEGWALYAEDIAIEYGFLNKDEHKFMMLRDRLWRSLRVILDVKLQTGVLGIDEAVDLMMSELRFSKEQAKSELSWYTCSPSVPLCYATGRELILQVRDEQVTDKGMEISAFHDNLLAQGSIALPLSIQCAFGESSWRKAHEAMLLGGKVVA